MGILINPGSGAVPASGEGWTNTLAGARSEAYTWLHLIEAEGIRDVVLDPDVEDMGDDGRWRFWFRHTVTGARVELETHGVDNVEAYEKERIFFPRVYWNGSSSGEPKVEDWGREGFEVVKTFRPTGEPL